MEKYQDVDAVCKICHRSRNVVESRLILLAGDQDPRSSAVALLGRALAALPAQVRDGAAAAGRKIALRADAGYFAGDLARAAAAQDMMFAIGAKRITSMWKALAGVGHEGRRDEVVWSVLQLPAMAPRPFGGGGAQHASDQRPEPAGDAFPRDVDSGEPPLDNAPAVVG